MKLKNGGFKIKEFKGKAKTKDNQIDQLLKQIIDDEERYLVLLDIGIIPFREDDIEPIFEDEDKKGT